MSEDGLYHDKIIEKLGELSAGQQHILSRLDKINGSVSHLYGEVTATKLAVVEHARDCPLRGRLDELDAQLLSGDHHGSVEVNKRLNALESAHTAILAREDAADKADEKLHCERNKWIEWVAKPLVYAAVAAIAALVLAHAGLFSHKP